jgi:hypothetical protein
VAERRRSGVCARRGGARGLCRLEGASGAREVQKIVEQVDPASEPWKTGTTVGTERKRERTEGLGGDLQRGKHEADMVIGG